MTEWENRPPAKFTLEKLKMQDGLNKDICDKINDMKLDMQGIIDKVEFMGKRFEEFQRINEEQHRKLISDIGVIGAQNKAMYEEIKALVAKQEEKLASKNAEYISYSILIIFALSALYFIFERIGLPH